MFGRVQPIRQNEDDELSSGLFEYIPELYEELTTDEENATQIDEKGILKATESVFDDFQNIRGSDEEIYNFIHGIALREAKEKIALRIGNNSAQQPSAPQTNLQCVIGSEDKDYAFNNKTCGTISLPPRDIDIEHVKGNVSAETVNICIECGVIVGDRQEAVSCDSCDRWQHRTCNTGITRALYRRAVKMREDIPFMCTRCDNMNIQPLVQAPLNSTSASTSMNTVVHGVDVGNLSEDVVTTTRSNKTSDCILMTPTNIMVVDRSDANHEPSVDSSQPHMQSTCVDPSFSDRIIVNERFPEDQQPPYEHIPDQPTTYEVVTRGSQKATDILVASDGYSYVVKKKMVVGQCFVSIQPVRQCQVDELSGELKEVSGLYAGQTELLQPIMVNRCLKPAAQPEATNIYEHEEHYTKEKEVIASVPTEKCTLVTKDTDDALNNKTRGTISVTPRDIVVEYIKGNVSEETDIIDLKEQKYENNFVAGPSSILIKQLAPIIKKQIITASVEHTRICHTNSTFSNTNRQPSLPNISIQTCKRVRDRSNSNEPPCKRPTLQAPKKKLRPGFQPLHKSYPEQNIEIGQNKNSLPKFELL